MDRIIFLIILILFSLFILHTLGIIRLTGFFVGFGPPASEFEWWNVSWHYRFKLEINSSSYNRTDWPIEQQVNFTDLLPSGIFDENSVRVFEYNSSGSVIYEVPSQFDKSEDFSASSNALGTLVFLLNGTTPPNTKRIFFVYYDKIENGAKQKPEYATNLAYDFNGEEFEVNNTILSFRVDTVRGENTSGLIRVSSLSGVYDVFNWPLPSDARTYEYMEYSNGTHNFSFDFRNNATLKYNGTIRLVVEQKGKETIWNSTDVTEEGFAVKRYIFYDKLQWIKVETNFTNIGSNPINRSSTFAGAIAIDAARAFESDWQSNFGNTTPPGWWFASDYWTNRHSGIIHLNQSGTNNFWVPNSSSKDRIGIELNLTPVDAGSSIIETAVIHFNYTQGVPAQVENLRNRLANPVEITQLLPEEWYVIISPSTNATVYNRNESVLITGNTSGDPYDLTKYMNATLDMGTPSSADDQTIILYDDGTNGDANANDKIFTNVFGVPNDAATGIWTINFTIYTNGSEFLNSTTFTFNVTDVLNVTVSIVNKKPVVGSTVIANINVKNYRQDSWAPGATINCSYNSTEVTNKTDYNNGTYSINFTAPSQEGNYTLYCNATKNGNFGNNTDTFTTEPGKTNINITAQPSNPIVSDVTLYDNDTFVISVNASNIGNGSAYSSNITLELLEGWDANSTLEECGEINKNGYCVKGFNITVPNGTSPGNYYINITATWKNPDESISLNKTEVNVTVESNPRTDVEEEKVSGEAGDGIWTLVGNFTVYSIGNDALQNITFSCVSGEACNNFLVGFIPENISSLTVNSKQNVSINVTIPLGYTPGTYDGTVNASTENDGFDTFTLEIVVPPKTNVSITPNISSYTASNITQENNETFYFKANATDIGNGSARFLNISVFAPSGWLVSPSLEECENIVKNEACSREFNVTIPEATQPGNYLVNVSTNWTQPDNSMGTNKTSITVTVASNPLINVSESNVSGIVLDGTEETLGNFTVLSIGNDALQNINFNCFSGEVCQNFTVEFIPATISTLPANSNQSVMVNVSVPLSYPAGTYSGTVNVSAQNDKFDTFTLEVTAPENRTWDLYPDYCERSTQEPEGIACEVNVTNKGNAQINFTVSPEEGNYTKVNETTFVVNRSSWHVFKITYNTTGASPGTYNSTFIVDAVQAGSNPDNKTVKVSLVPYIPPMLNISLTPSEAEENSSVKILTNVTDRSGYGIAFAKVNITRPNGTVDSLDMFLIDSNGNLTRWELTYPNGTNGSTAQKGTYNFTVYAKDNIGNEGQYNSSFLICIKLNIVLSTLSDKYYQGDTGAIYYVARNLTNNPLQNVTVNFTIQNSQGNVTYLSSNFQTNSDGTINPLPSFSVSSDAPLGNYTLISFSKYFDSIANKSLEIEKNYTFQVLSRTVTVTGLFADVETAVVWYPENIMRFGILVYNGEGRPVEPTSMNLTVYDPANNLYFFVGMPQMTKQATGYYTYQYAMPSNTPSGMFLAVLNVSQNEFHTMKLKAFRVAHGGPYDIRVNLLENEVEQGSYLDFILTIENKGEVSQDVYVEYWVSSQDSIYYSTSEAVLTPALSNQSFTRTAYVRSDQPLGSYYLNVKVTYDSVQPPIIVNSSFVVVSKVSPTVPPPTYYPSYPYLPTGAALVPAPTEKILASILISKYENNISLARGFTKIESVVVSNTGQVELGNVSLFLLGIPTSWFNITPETYRTLQKDGSTVFLITFNIPRNVKLGEYGATLVATSGVVSDQKKVTITVLESIEELLKQEIKKLKEDLQNLQVDAKVAEKEGKDVSGVTIIIDEIKSQVDAAEENLEEKKTEEALSNISNAKNLVEKARDLLSKLEISRLRGFILPVWVIFLVIILIAVLSISAILWKKRKGPALRPWIIPLGKVVDTIKGRKVSKDEIIKERERLLRMLEVLEKEKDEKAISIGAYREMRKNIEKKLSKIEEKIH